MKPCLICHTANPDSAVTCSACGEGSFGPADGAVPLTDKLGTGAPKADKPSEGGEKPKQSGRKPKADKPSEGGRE